MVWNDEAVELAKSMINEGQSASQVGRVLGCSRNAVIGKMHRIGFKFAGGVAAPRKAEFAKRVKSERMKGRSKEGPAPVRQVNDYFFGGGKRKGNEVAMARGEAERRVTAGITDQRVKDAVLARARSRGDLAEYMADVTEATDLPRECRQRQPVKLLDLKHGECRWPVADGGFCGDPVWDGCSRNTSYCETHHRMAYIPVSRMSESSLDYWSKRTANSLNIVSQLEGMKA